MKIPSLFTKAPKHQRFNYTPRYYDPLKEEMEARQARIRREVAEQQGEVVEPTNGDYASRMKGSFHAARKRSKTPYEPNAVILRLAVAMFISLFLIAFLTWGKAAIYSLLIFIPVYIYFKFFKK